MKFIDKVIGFSTKHPVIVLIIVGMITAVFMLALPSFRIDLDVRGNFSKDDETIIMWDYVNKIFESPEAILLVSVNSDNAYSNDTIEYVNKLHTIIEKWDIDFTQEFDKLTENTPLKTNQITELIPYVISEDYKALDEKLSKLKKQIENKGIEEENINDLVKSILTGTGKDIAQYLEGVRERIADRDDDYIKETISIINAGSVEVVEVDGEHTMKQVDFFPEKDKGERDLYKTKEEQQELKKIIDNDPFLSGAIVSQKKNEKGLPKALSIIAEFKQTDDAVYYDKFIMLDKLLKKNLNPKYETKVYGNNYYMDYLANQTVEEDFQIQGLLIIILMFLVYFINFKSIRGVLLPILINIITAVWVFGLMVYSGIQIAEMETMVVILLLAISSSYAIHLLNQYYKDAPAYSKDKKVRAVQLKESTKHILTTILFAGLTTFIGITSFITSDIVHFRNYGIFAGIGVLMAVILSFTFGPALLRVLNVSRRKRHVNFNNKLSDKVLRAICVSMIRFRKSFFIVLTLILVTAVVFGVPQISTELTFENMFREGHPIQELSTYFSDNYGSTYIIDLVIDANPEHPKSMEDQIKEMINKRVKGIEEESGNESGIDENKDTLFDSDSSSANGDEEDTLFDSDSTESTDPNVIDDIDKELSSFEEKSDTMNYALKSDFLKEVEKLENYLEKNVPGVHQVISLATIIKHFNYVWNGKNEEYDTIPDNTQTILNYIEMFSGSDKDYDGVSDDLEGLIDPTFNKILVSVRLEHLEDRFISSSDFDNINETILNYMENDFKGDVEYRTAGITLVITKMQDWLNRSLYIALIIAILGVCLIVTILFRSIKMGLLSMVPMVFAVMMNFGIMGLTGIPLNASTSILSTLIIGIGIDDTIHFLLRLRKELKDSKNEIAGIETIVYRTFRHTSKAIVFTSLALILGFGVFLTSSLVSLQQFGILVIITMFNALIATLLYLPSLILIAPRLVGIRRKEGKDFEVDDSFLATGVDSDGTINESEIEKERRKAEQKNKSRQ